MTGAGTTLVRNRDNDHGHLRERGLLEDLAPGRPTRRRNWPRVGAAAALAVLSGGLFVALYASAGDRHPVLALAREIPAGAAITAGDLVTARVAPDAALVPIPAQDAASVIGRRAVVRLLPGTLLTAGELVVGPMVGASSSSVGLDLKPGEVPVGLAPGDPVLVVETNGAGAGAGQSVAGGPGQGAVAPTVLVDRATVLSVTVPSANAGSGDTAITIEVPAPLAAAVVTAAAAGEVALAGLGPTGGG